MYKDQKKRINKPDLTRIDGGQSVGKRFEKLLTNADKYSLNELKIEVVKILDDPTTHVSKPTIYKYKTAVERIYTLKEMQRFITNLYLSAANMSLTLK